MANDDTNNQYIAATTSGAYIGVTYCGTVGNDAGANNRNCRVFIGPSNTRYIEDVPGGPLRTWGGVGEWDLKTDIPFNNNSDHVQERSSFLDSHPDVKIMTDGTVAVPITKEGETIGYYGRLFNGGELYFDADGTRAINTGEYLEYNSEVSSEYNKLYTKEGGFVQTATPTSSEADPAQPETGKTSVEVQVGTGDNATKVTFTEGNKYIFNKMSQVQNGVEYTLVDITAGTYMFQSPDGEKISLSRGAFENALRSNQCEVTNLGVAENLNDGQNPAVPTGETGAATQGESSNTIFNLNALDYIGNFKASSTTEGVQELIDSIMQGAIRDVTGKTYKDLECYNGLDAVTKKHYQYADLDGRHSEAAEKFNQDAQNLMAKIENLKANASGENTVWKGKALEKVQTFLANIEKDGEDLAKAYSVLVEVTNNTNLIKDMSKELFLLKAEEERVQGEIEKCNNDIKALGNEPTPATTRPIIGDDEKNGQPIYGKPEETEAHKTWRETKKKLEDTIQELTDYLTLEPKGISVRWKARNDEMTRIEDAIRRLQQEVKKVVGEPGDPGGQGGPPKEIEYIDTTQEQMAYYKELDPSIFDGMVLNLFALANQKGVGIEVLLSDSSYSELIKNMVLNTEGLSYDMIELVKKGNIDISQNLLRNIIFAETDEAKDIFKLNNKTNVEVIKNILQRKAGDTDLAEYIKNGSNIKNALRDIKNVNGYVGSLGGDNTANELLSVYRGDSDNSLAENSDNFESSSVIKDLLDIESSQKSLTVEDLLSSNDSIQEPLGNLYRATGFLSSIDRYSDEAAAVLISNLLK